jgi:ribosome maturation factor RimP
MFLKRADQLKIADHIDACLKDLSLTCLDVEWEAQPRILTVYIDLIGLTPDKFATHAGAQVGFRECEMASVALTETHGPSLDALIPCEFTLQVSSPGIARPLRKWVDFATAAVQGAEVEVRLEEKVQNRRNGKGFIAEANEPNVTLKTAEGVWTFPIDKVLKATVIPDWDRVMSEAHEPSDGGEENSEEESVVQA